MNTEKSTQESSSDSEIIAAPSLSQADLLEMISRLDKQVADLQVDQVRSNRPWWRDALTILTLLALVFSIATTVFAFTQNAQQRRHELRTEFRDIALRLSAIPREEFDANFTGRTPGQIANYLGLLQDERLTLLGQADEIEKAISGDLSPSEYYLLAKASAAASHYSQARTYYETAATRATTDLSGYANAQRAIGQMELRLGNLQAGREDLQMAVSKLQGAVNDNPRFLDELERTYMVWADTEYELNNCNEFLDNYEQAKITRKKLNELKLPSSMTNTYSDAELAIFKNCPKK